MSRATACRPCGITPLVLIELVVLNLEKEVVRPEHVDVLARKPASFVVLVAISVSLMSPRRQADIAMRPLECRASRSLSMRGL